MLIVIAAAIWGLHWQGCHVCFHSDNKAVVSVLVKRAAKDACMNHLLRTLFSMRPSTSFTFRQSTYPAFITLRLMPCHVMILLPFPVFFLRWCLWSFWLWCWIWWWRLTQIALFGHSLFRASSPAVSAHHSGIR